MEQIADPGYFRAQATASHTSRKVRARSEHCRSKAASSAFNRWAGVARLKIAEHFPRINDGRAHKAHIGALTYIT